MSHSSDAYTQAYTHAHKYVYILYIVQMRIFQFVWRLLNTKNKKGANTKWRYNYIVQQLKK